MPHLDMSAWAIEKVMRVLLSCCRGSGPADHCCSRPAVPLSWYVLVLRLGASYTVRADATLLIRKLHLAQRGPPGCRLCKTTRGGACSASATAPFLATKWCASSSQSGPNPCQPP